MKFLKEKCDIFGMSFGPKNFAPESVVWYRLFSGLWHITLSISWETEQKSGLQPCEAGGGPGGFGMFWDFWRFSKG